MKTITCVLLLLFSITATSGITSAQSLDSLLRDAYRNNPQLQSAGHQIEAAASRAAAAGALPAPSLGIEFSQVPFGSADIVNGAVSNNISFSQMLMLGGKLSAMQEMEKIRGSGFEHVQESLLVRIRANVKMNYVRLWRIDRQIEFQHRTIRLLEELGASLRSRLATNRTRSADVLVVESEIESERARLDELSAQRMNAQNALAALCAPQVQASRPSMRMGTLDTARMEMNGRGSGRADLRRLLGSLNGGYAIVPDSVLPAPPAELSEEALAENLLAYNPSLQAMEHMKLMNEAGIAAANKELIPDVMLQAMVMRMPNGMILTSGARSAEAVAQSAMGMPMGKTEWMYSLMASVTLPFMPWSSQRSTARADEMHSLNLSVDAEERTMQREMLAQLRSSLNTYRMQDSLARRYGSRVVPLALQAAEAQTVAYQTGQAPLQSVIDARRMVIMKQDDYLMAVMNQHMALIELEMMVGVPLQ